MNPTARPLRVLLAEDAVISASAVSLKNGMLRAAARESEPEPQREHAVPANVATQARRVVP